MAGICDVYLGSALRRTALRLGSWLDAIIDREGGIQPDMLAWKWCIGILCVIAILIGLALIQSHKQLFPAWLLQLSNLVGAALVALYVMWSYLINSPPYWLLGVGVLCVVGALVPMALTQAWGKYISRLPMLVYTWVGGVLLTLHALYGMIVHGLAAAGIITWAQVQQWAGAPVSPMAASAVRELIIESMLVWNPWFLLGGLSYLAMAWYGTRRVPSAK